jgi:hypothetical protein
MIKDPHSFRKKWGTFPIGIIYHQPSHLSQFFWLTPTETESNQSIYQKQHHLPRFKIKNYLEKSLCLPP